MPTWQITYRDKSKRIVEADWMNSRETGVVSFGNKLKAPFLMVNLDDVLEVIETAAAEHAVTEVIEVAAESHAPTRSLRLSLLVGVMVGYCVAVVWLFATASFDAALRAGLGAVLGGVVAGFLMWAGQGRSRNSRR